MKLARQFLVFLLMILWCSFLQAQQKSRYNFYRYSVNEGLLQSTVLDLEVDQNNFCWLSFSNGIQRFDGNSFKIIPVQPGLPDDKNTGIYRQQNGILLFEHTQGISQFDIQKNAFHHVFIRPEKHNKPVKILGEWNKIIVFYDKAGFFHFLNPDKYNVVKTIAVPLLANQYANGSLIFSNIKDGHVSFYLNGRFYQYDLAIEKIIYTSGVLLPPVGLYLEQSSKQELLYFNSGNEYGLNKYNFRSGSIEAVFRQQTQQFNYRGILFDWKGSRLMSYFNKLYFMSADLKKDSAELINFKNKAIIGNSTATKIVADNFDNLYLVTINDGIRKIIRNSYPLKFFGMEGDNNSYALCVYADKNTNRILVGTKGNGILVFDSLQNIVKHVQRLPGEQISFTANNITRNTKGEYIFTVLGKSSAFLLSSSLLSVSKLPVSNTNNAEEARYFSNLLYNDSLKAILQTEFRLFVVNKQNNNVQQFNLKESSTHGGLLHKGKLFIHSANQVQVYDTSAFKVLKTFPFANTSGVRCYNSNGNNIYLGSNKGIFVVDENFNILKQYNRSTGLPDECIYSIHFDAQQNLWCSTNKGIFRIAPSGQIFQLTKEDGLQENEFNNNVSYQSADGELYFGGVNGVNSFYPEKIPDYMVDLGVYITGIKINNQDFVADTSYQYIKKINLAHDENSIALAFIASGEQNPQRYIHQYKMEGLDKEWLQQPAGETVRYVLPPGDYVFKMYASGSFDSKAVAIKELHIKINPPFWKAWWFLALVSIAAVGLIVYLINRYNHARYQKKVAALLMIQKVQEERERISMELHDSIGAYANAVLYNTELLQNEVQDSRRQSLMKDLRFASKDIITSLRETIWALKNENYTAEECMMRVRNFIHPFSRYYPGINFKIEGEVPQQKELHYGTALNIVRIVQEAVNNAIKHGQAKNISIKTRVAIAAWHMVIDDDGKGFDEKNITPGNGIINMKKRAEEKGLIVEITSKPAEGTHVSIIIP
ncbi:MAG: hypothetical protein EOP53_05785 [Sphingobacteriales bacterium]|nr:MAG: hypothetical protein EOP53_05785 [Sphingobacteriales bacterium]